MLFFLPVQAHKLADGWSFVPRDPAVEPDIDVNTYTFEKKGNLKKEFQNMSAANNCTLSGKISAEKNMYRTECSNPDREAKYTLYIRESHGQLLLIGAYNVEFVEIDEFIKGLEVEDQK